MIISLFFDYCLAAANPRTTIDKNNASLFPGAELQLGSGAKICLILTLVHMEKTETLPKNAFVIGDEDSNQHAQVRYNMEWVLCKGSIYCKMEGTETGPTEILEENIPILLKNTKLTTEEPLKHFLYNTFGNYPTNHEKLKDVPKSKWKNVVDTVYIRKCENTKIQIEQKDNIMALEGDQPDNTMLAIRFNKGCNKMEYVVLDKATTKKVCEQADIENKQRFIFSRSQLENVLISKGTEKRVIYFKTQGHANTVIVKDSNKSFNDNVLKRIPTIDHEYKELEEDSEDEEYYDCLEDLENMNLDETDD